jgi:transcriptional regulator with XRE-family HTH domain
VAVLASADVCLIVARIQNVSDALLIVDPVIDLETRILARLPGLLVHPAQILNGVMWIGVITPGLVNAGNSDRHTLFSCDTERRVAKYLVNPTGCDYATRIDGESTLFCNGLRMADDKRLDLTKLGQQIRFLRQGKGWSLSDLMEHSGVSKAYISDVENAAAGKPNIQYVYSIATALGVTLDELLENATPSARQRRRKSEELPPGLAQLQEQMELSDDEVETLAQVNFRGNRPKDVEGWRFLLEALKMLGQRNTQR